MTDLELILDDGDGPPGDPVAEFLVAMYRAACRRDVFVQRILRDLVDEAAHELAAHYGE